MSLALSLGLLVAALAVVVFGVWFGRRARRRAPAVAAAPPAAWVPPPPEPKKRLESAVAQACTEAFNAWWRGRRDCAACGAPAFFVAPRQNELCAEFHHPTRGRGGFISWTQVIGCSACGWSLSFHHTDASPLDPEPLQRDAAAATPARAWSVTTGDTRAGLVQSDAEGVRIDADPGVDGAGRAALSITAALVRAVRSAVEPGVAPADVRTIVDWVLLHHLRMRGARVEPVISAP